jgi:hypothetical protein
MLCDESDKSVWTQSFPYVNPPPPPPPASRKFGTKAAIYIIGRLKFTALGDGDGTGKFTIFFEPQFNFLGVLLSVMLVTCF